MGVYLGLEIIPDYIYQDEWERVFEESFKLIQAYPFATLSVEQKDDYKRLVLEPTKEQHLYVNGKTERYWKINGDLESKVTGEGFTLSSNLDKYCERKKDIPEKDILLYQAKDSGRRASKVFHAKTQGLPYHTPLLAVAALIESRFPQYSCVYGDITKEQAQKSVEWANSVLDNPINLPVRVDAPKLLERLKAIDSKEKQLEDLYELFIGDSEDVDRLVGKHFSIETVSRYLANELRHFNSATQLGAELLIIKGLNIGLPLETLIDICCFHENGPRFIPVEFSKALCSTWVMVAPKIRGNMNLLNKSPELPETVESQFGSIFLDMNFMGRRTKRFIPKDEVLEVLKRKFNNNDQIVEIIETKYQELVRKIEGKGRRLEEIEEELHPESEQNIVSTFEELLYWDETKIVSEGINEILVSIKNATNDSLSKKDGQVMQVIGGLDKGPLIKLISKLAQDQHNLILTRNAWDWIESENNDSLKQMVLLEKQGWNEPNLDDLPTGNDLVQQYLIPLANTPEIKKSLFVNTKVLSISRKNIDKMKTTNREKQPFIIFTEQNGEFKQFEARAVIDATGTGGNPNPTNSSGVWLKGEVSIRNQIFYGIPDILGKDRSRYLNKRVAVVGGGHSAINSLLELVKLKEEYPETEIVWVMRKDHVKEAYGGEDLDALEARGDLGSRIHQTVDSGVVQVFTPFKIQNVKELNGKIELVGFNKGNVDTISNIEEIIVNTGNRPDFSILREVRTSIDTITESVEALAPLIDPNIHSCGTVRPHGEKELRQPDKDFYIVGAKSYGRAPTFLMATGYEQVRSVVAYLTGDYESSEKVELDLPETGVCKTNINDTNSSYSSDSCCS